jgi:hypothetical protein
VTGVAARQAVYQNCGKNITVAVRFWGYAVAQLVGALRYKPEGHWDFSLA